MQQRKNELAGLGIELLVTLGYVVLLFIIPALFVR